MAVVDICSVEANAKKYELVSVGKDPMYEEFRSSIDTVKKFIQERGLVIYGGTAIDYALRLKGDNIYPDDMLAVPDLDVFSTDSLGDAYRLTDVLYAEGRKEARCIRAFYIRTMRVDIGDKRWVCDVSFVDRKILERIPVVEYESMRVVHPDFQRIDLHSSLSFPFDEAPREVIFARWRKDVARFAKLAKAYPVETDATPLPPFVDVVVPESFSKYVFHGWAAYALLYEKLLADAGKRPISSKVVPMRFTHNTFKAPNNAIDLIHFDPEEIGVARKTPAPEVYAAIQSAIPKRYVYPKVTSGLSNVNVFSTHNRLVVTASVDLHGRKYKCAGVQYLMMWFMAMSYFADLAGGIASPNLYRVFYNSTLEMVNEGCRFVGSDLTGDALNDSVWWPNVHVYGNANMSEGFELSLETLRAEQRGERGAMTSLPMNYRPGKSPHPAIDYTAEFFIKDGRWLRRNA